MKSLYIVAAALLMGALSPASMAQVKVLELGYEATSTDVRMPTSESGELTLQGCATCKVLRLRANAATRYVIGGVHVSLTEMTRYLTQNPEASLVIMQLKDTSDLSRVVVHVAKRAQ